MREVAGKDQVSCLGRVAPRSLAQDVQKCCQEAMKGGSVKCVTVKLSNMNERQQSEHPTSTVCFVVCHPVLKYAFVRIRATLN